MRAAPWWEALGEKILHEPFRNVLASRAVQLLFTLVRNGQRKLER